MEADTIAHAHEYSSYITSSHIRRGEKRLVANYCLLMRVIISYGRLELEFLKIRQGCTCVSCSAPKISTSL